MYIKIYKKNFVHVYILHISCVALFRSFESSIYIYTMLKLSVEASVLL